MADKIKSAEGEKMMDKINFTKEQILSAERYIHRKDALNVILETDGVYDFGEVDALLEKFMKGKVN